ACGYTGATLFGVNTGLRGATLAGVLNQSRARLLVVGQRFAEEVECVRGDLKHLGAEQILVLRTEPDRRLDGVDLADAVASEIGSPERALDPPGVDVDPTAVLIVIYTSGTTGLPKGINNNHLKMLGIGMVVSGRLGLGT